MDMRIGRRFSVGMIHITGPIKHRGIEGLPESILQMLDDFKEIDHFLRGQMRQILCMPFS